MLETSCSDAGIKGLLAVPFVLHSQPTAIFEPQNDSTDKMTTGAQRRYVEIMRDVEELINDHSKYPSHFQNR
jgi:IMP and pyridine-specific 5'-nucleotidase